MPTSASGFCAAIAFAVTLPLAGGCKRGHGTTPAADPCGTVERIFQARMPASATNVRVESESLFTTVFQGTFQCSLADLAEFLKTSRLLPDELEAGLDPFAGMQIDVPWWRAGDLADMSGALCDWRDGNEVASCRFARGRLPDGKVTVYFMVIYESDKATSRRPETHADPNWVP